MGLDTDILIVGTGQAGVQAACELRRRGFEGSILLVGDEREEPYERPPLTKDYLAGRIDAEQLRFQPALFWREARIDRRLSTQIVSVDTRAKAAKTADGLAFHYGQLVWAAGGAARRLHVPGSELHGVATIRTRDDADRVRGLLADARNVVVVGGGYIGLEAAASIRRLRKTVTVIETQDRVLARAVAPPMSAAVEAAHRAEGVRVLTGRGVAAFRGANGRIAQVEICDGRLLPADLVIVGVGLQPHQDVLARAGAVVGDGVLVDRDCRSSLPDVFAVGDCARQPRSEADGAALRLESVANAIEQGTAAAAAILGQPPAPAGVPWFWSDQYDLRLQCAGLKHEHDDLVVRGAPGDAGFSVIYLRRGAVVALECLNASPDFLAGKRLIAQGATPDRSALADPTKPLKSLLRTAA